ncbi:MAG: DNA mismatch repair endonuclease MutL [Candidatus Sumerlaeia bacterium]
MSDPITPAPRIRQLPPALVNKIAAGEVVVRPASVVKELVENAIDAGSQKIVVRVSDDGRSISVIDDGCGMTPEETRLSLERHATSKISSLDDLSRIQTRGFRGEALPSIASVSQMEIRTRPANAVSGWQIRLEGGKIVHEGAVGCPQGTSVWVRALFFNTPARLKFLKSPASELSAIIRTALTQALGAPHIGFALYKEDEKIFDLPPAQPLAFRFQELLGSAVSPNQLLDVNFEEQGVRVTGVLAKPEASRKDRRHEYLFVNGRPVVTKTLHFAVEEAMRGLLMTQRFPLFALFIEIAPQLVDVNVHPTKEEVRFENERLVAGRVHRAVAEALRGANLVPLVKWTGDAQNAERHGRTPEGGGEAAGGGPAGSRTIDVVHSLFKSPLAWTAHAMSGGKQQTSFPERSISSDADSPAPVASADQASAPSASDADSESESSHASGLYRIPCEEPEPEFWDVPWEATPIGQVADSYIVAQFGPHLLLIDQHAAHERVLYMKFRGRRAPEVQPLLLPVMVQAPAESIARLRKIEHVLRDEGFDIEVMGGRTVVVKSAPADLPHLNIERFILDLLDDLEHLGGRRTEAEAVRDRIWTRSACHAAIKANRPLSHDEMRALLHDIRKARLAFTCPHGRPTMLLLTRDMLDRQFKRTS